MKGIKRQPATLDGRPLNDPLREFYRNTSKASLFDALCDRVALQHPESADEAVRDSDWMSDKLTATIGVAGSAKRHQKRKDPVCVDLPPPIARGFDKMFRYIGDRIDGKDGAKPARVDPNPTIAPGTTCKDAAVCGRCGLRYPVRDGEPITQAPYTCDDCGGAVGVG